MKRIIQKAAIAVIALLAVGCTTTKTNELDANESTNLADKSLTMSKYSEPPGFFAMTAANTQFALVGMATAQTYGDAMIENRNIEDPAIEISRRLAHQLQEDYGVKIVEETAEVKSTDNLADVVKAYETYDYVLDVKTRYWQSRHYPADWDNYRIEYSAHARLIDVRSKSVIAEEVCESAPEYEDTNQGPTYANLENGDGLKKELARAVEFCVEHIGNMTKLHHISTAPIAQ